MVKFLSMLSLAFVTALISFTVSSSDATVSNILISDGFEESSLTTFIRENSSENDCELISSNGFSGAPEEAGHPILHAVDGNPNTRWAGKSRNAEIILTYPESFVTCQAVFKWFEGGVDGRVYSFELYGSRDGQTFDILLLDNKSAPNSDYQSLMLKPERVKAVKLVVKGNSNNDWAGLYEFALSKKKVSEDNPSDTPNNDVPANKDCELIGPNQFTASHEQDVHPVLHAVDGDPNTRWAGKSREAQVILSYPESFETCQILFKWFRGGIDGRVYPFEVYGSKDGQNFNTTLLNSQSSPNEYYQHFNLERATVRAIKIVIKGNSNNEWAGLYEVALKKRDKGNDDVVDDTGWRSSLYPSNWTPESVENKSFERDAFIQDFSMAGYRYGSTPSTRPNARVFNVINYGADKTGNRDSTDAIQNAINAAQNVNDANNPGGIVYLPAGTYKVSPQGDNVEALRISKSHIILRGEGVGKTFLLNTRKDMRKKRVIRVRPGGWQSPYADRSPRILLAKDVLTPTRNIPLQSVDGLYVGQWIVLRNNTTDAWADEHSESGWRGSKAHDRLRGQVYIRKIEKINSATKTIEIDMPVRYYLKKRDNARLHGLADGFLKEVGIEGFSIGMLEQDSNSDYGEGDWNVRGRVAYNSHDAEMINIERTRDSWVKDVSSFQPSLNKRGVHMLSNGLTLREAARISVIDTVMKNTQYGGGGGNGYGFTLIDTQDSLLIRTQAHFTRHGYSLGKLGTSGNVLHKCLDVDSGRAKADGNGYATGGRASDAHN